MALGSNTAELWDYRLAQGSEVGLGLRRSQRLALAADGGAAVLSAAPLPVLSSLQLPKMSRSRTLPLACQRLLRQGLLKPESHFKTKCALEETDTILYFCEMILILLHVYVAHFSGIQGKGVSWVWNVNKGSNIV